MGILFMLMFFILSILNLVIFNIFKVIHNNSEEYHKNQKIKFYQLEKNEYSALFFSSFLVCYLFMASISIGNSETLCNDTWLIAGLASILCCQFLIAIKFKTLSNTLTIIIAIIAILNFFDPYFILDSFINKLISALILFSLLLLFSKYLVNINRKDIYLAIALGLFIPLEIIFPLILRSIIFIIIFYLILLILRKKELLKNLSYSPALMLSFLTLFCR